MQAELARDPVREEIRSRPFRTGDANALARFWREREFDIPGGMYHGVPSIDGAYVLASMKKHRTVWAMVALQGDRIVGYNELRRMDAHTLHVCYLYLSPEARGHGFGSEFAFLAYQYLASLPPGQVDRVVSNFSPANVIVRRMTARAGSPESAAGRLEILISTLLTLPVFRRFADTHQLFRSYAHYCRAFSRDVTDVVRVPPDPQDGHAIERFEWHGVAVYPHRFTSGDDWVEVLVDTTSRGIRRVACPEWRAAVLPLARSADPDAAACRIEITNTSPRTIAAALAGDTAPTRLSPGETLAIDAGRKAPTAGRRHLSVHCTADGDPLTLRVPLTQPTPTALSSCSPRVARVAPATADEVLVARRDGLRAELDPSRGGSVRGLKVHGIECLRAATGAVESLGWIHPWRGGLFYLLHGRRQRFRLDAWGPYPGFCGFNTDPDECTITETGLVRASSKGRLAERTAFQLEPDGLILCTVVENRGSRPASCAFGVFAFLNDSNAGRARTREGEAREASRRSFELTSDRGVEIELPSRRLSFDACQGRLTCTAFNLGDDGLHLMARASMTIAGHDQVALGLTLRITMTDLLTTPPSAKDRL